jgi:hypothetical protein
MTAHVVEASSAARNAPPPHQMKSARYVILWAIMADPDLNAPSKCAATVLLLKYHNHKTGQCNPSYSTVGKILGRDRRNVINAINDLRAAGWIEWTGTKGGSSSNTNGFKFKMKGPASSDEVVTHTGDEVITGDEKSMRGDEVVTLPVTYSPHELSIELSKNHKSCRVAKATPTKNEYSEDFETNFWKPFPRTAIMSKKEAWREWMKLDLEQRLANCRAIEPYRRHLAQNPTLHAVHACRFLSQNRAEGILELAAEKPSINIRSSMI